MGSTSEAFVMESFEQRIKVCALFFGSWGFHSKTGLLDKSQDLQRQSARCIVHIQPPGGPQLARKPRQLISKLAWDWKTGGQTRLESQNLQFNCGSSNENNVALR